METALDVEDGKAENCRQVVQWPRRGGPGQRFGIDPISDADR